MKIIHDFDTIKATNKMKVVHTPMLKTTPNILYILIYFFSENVPESNNLSILVV